MTSYIRDVLGISIFIIVGALYFTACADHVNSVYEDLTGPYTQLKVIEEASNTTVTVNKGVTQGLDSYFAFDVSNINPNGILREGLTEGWCLEWNKTIAQNNDVHSEVKMYNSYGDKTWKPANYLMNIKDKLQDEDPEITYREIQVALWSLIETPSFDLDQVLEDNKIPPRLMNGENPAFDVDKVKEIVKRVRYEVPGFSYKPGSVYLVFARTEEGGKMEELLPEMKRHGPWKQRRVK